MMLKSKDIVVETASAVGQWLADASLRQARMYIVQCSIDIGTNKLDE